MQEELKKIDEALKKAKINRILEIVEIVIGIAFIVGVIVAITFSVSQLNSSDQSLNQLEELLEKTMRTNNIITYLSIPIWIIHVSVIVTKILTLTSAKRIKAKEFDNNVGFVLMIVGVFVPFTGLIGVSALIKELKRAAEVIENSKTIEE